MREVRLSREPKASAQENALGIGLRSLRQRWRGRLRRLLLAILLFFRVGSGFALFPDGDFLDLARRHGPLGPRRRALDDLVDRFHPFRHVAEHGVFVVEARGGVDNKYTVFGHVTKG